MDTDRFERMIAPDVSRRSYRPASEAARKRLRAMAGPMRAGRTRGSLDEKRAIHLAGPKPNDRKGSIGGA
jgi:hypothetical protein